MKKFFNSGKNFYINGDIGYKNGLSLDYIFKGCTNN